MADPSLTLQFRSLRSGRQPGAICDMQGVVVSAGEHDFDERSGGTVRHREQSASRAFLADDSAGGGRDRERARPHGGRSGRQRNYIWTTKSTRSVRFLPAGDGNACGSVSSRIRWFFLRPARRACALGHLRTFGFISCQRTSQCFRKLDGLAGLMRYDVPGWCSGLGGASSSGPSGSLALRCPQPSFLDGAYGTTSPSRSSNGEGADPTRDGHLAGIGDTSVQRHPVRGDRRVLRHHHALVKNSLNNAPSPGNTSRFNVPVTPHGLRRW